jgi:hypothetical protein
VEIYSLIHSGFTRDKLSSEFLVSSFHFFIAFGSNVTCEGKAIFYEAAYIHMKLLVVILSMLCYENVDCSL